MVCVWGVATLGKGLMSPWSTGSSSWAVAFKAGQHWFLSAPGWRWEGEGWGWREAVQQGALLSLLAPSTHPPRDNKSTNT